MATLLKPLELLAEKYSRRSQAAAPEYKAGVAAPGKDWAANTAGSKDAWSQGVSEAASQGRFEREVRKAGNAKWQSKSTDVGAPRYADGVSKAKGDWQVGFGPSAAVIAAVAPPTKGPRGSAQNMERVRAYADALHQRRISGGS